MSEKILMIFITWRIQINPISRCSSKLACLDLSRVFSQLTWLSKQLTLNDYWCQFGSWFSRVKGRSREPSIVMLLAKKKRARNENKSKLFMYTTTLVRFGLFTTGGHDANSWLLFKQHSSGLLLFKHTSIYSQNQNPSRNRGEEDEEEEDQYVFLFLGAQNSSFPPRNHFYFVHRRCAAESQV